MPSIPSEIDQSLVLTSMIYGNHLFVTQLQVKLYLTSALGNFQNIGKFVMKTKLKY